MNCGDEGEEGLRDYEPYDCEGERATCAGRTGGQPALAVVPHRPGVHQLNFQR